MKIAVLSGKGGTGKTLLSVNLAAVGGLENKAEKVTYVDCDVEEPNGRLFLKPDDIIEENVSVSIPSVNKDLCTGCRRCVEFCKFNALAIIKDKVLVFDEVCHGCGGCQLVCPEGAMTEKPRLIGKIEQGISQNVNVLTGVLNTGEVSGVPVIRRLLEKSSTQADGQRLQSNELTIIDCPPGCACVVMESIKDADYCILVAEPTIFGAHNLEMVYDLVKMYGKKFGVALNKTLEKENDGDIQINPSEEFCKKIM